MTSRLSKSRLLTSLQCQKRLWLEVYHPEFMVHDDQQSTDLEEGQRFGALARLLLGDGDLIGAPNLEAALSQTKKLLNKKSDSDYRLYEATLHADGILVQIDCLEQDDGMIAMTEVKASTKVKQNSHLPDAAIQYYVLDQQGMAPDEIAIGLINNRYKKSGKSYDANLIKRVDVTDKVKDLAHYVPLWVSAARTTLANDTMPAISTGNHCTVPYKCPFSDHCRSAEQESGPVKSVPLTVLDTRSKLYKELAGEGYKDIRQVPYARMTTPKARGIWRAHQHGDIWTDQSILRKLGDLPWPRHHLDFESVQFMIPRWEQTKPYQAIPCQFSIHHENQDGTLTHDDYLHHDDTLPARAVALHLIKALGNTKGPILTYSSYERTCIKMMTQMNPDLAGPLGALLDRLFDIMPIVKNGFYHPAMMGKISIKTMLPLIPNKSGDYNDLEGVANGREAMNAYKSLICDDLDKAKAAKTREALLAYCKLDTQAMVDLTTYLQSFIAGKNLLVSE